MYRDCAIMWTKETIVDTCEIWLGIPKSAQIGMKDRMAMTGYVKPGSSAAKTIAARNLVIIFLGICTGLLIVIVLTSCIFASANGLVLAVLKGVHRIFSNIVTFQVWQSLNVWCDWVGDEF